MLVDAVRYVVMLVDGVTFTESREEGVEFYLKDGHFCPALPKAIKSMTKGEKVDLIAQSQSKDFVSYKLRLLYAFGDEVASLPNTHPPVTPDSILHVSLKLVSFKPEVNITDDAKVVKKILKVGKGSLTAYEGASVIVRFTGMLEDGTIFEKKGYDGETLFCFITDEGASEDCLRKLVSLLCAEAIGFYLSSEGSSEDLSSEASVLQHYYKDYVKGGFASSVLISNNSLWTDEAKTT
ncbi:hypothetical protein R6Q59_023647 [Mikania micrantha]